MFLRRVVKKRVTINDNQIYFEYKSESPFELQLFWQAVADSWSGRAGYMLPVSDVWVAVHMDWTDQVKSIFTTNPTAGDAGAPFRFDLEDLKDHSGGMIANVPIYVRNLRIGQKSYE